MSTVEQPPMWFADAVERVVLAMSRRWLTALMLYGAIATALAAAAPLLKAAGLTSLSTPIYFAFSFVCHQHADRSLHLHAEPMAFCMRDFAIFAGAVGIAVVFSIVQRFAHTGQAGTWLIVLAVIPIGVDGFTQLAGLRESTPLLRVATGLLFSMSLGWYLLPRLESGFRTVQDDIEHRRAAQASGGADSSARLESPT